MQELIERLRLVYASHVDPGHDWLHIQRVMANAERIGGQVGAQMHIVLPAALLHDIVNVPKNSPDRAHASQMAADAARSYLTHDVDAIAQVIVEHSYSRGLQPSTLESAVMQDADRLDAIGAIGVMRVMSTCSLMHSRFYDPEPHTLDDKRNALDHFEVKLFKLTFNTEPARIEAARRVTFMRAFLDQLHTEI